MDAVRGYVKKLVRREEEVANVIYPLFTNNHEAAAVIREELEELEEAVEENDLERIKGAAVCAAVEAIQVAAMAQKAVDSEKECKGE